MRQLVQSMRHGSVSVVDVPLPQFGGPGVLVRTAASVVSAGTERAALDFGRASLLDKAWSRPDLVRQVLEKASREGVLPAARAALARLDKPAAPGYASAGTVLGVDDAPELAVGDRVACAGAGYATHAEVNYVPKNLVVPIPRRPSGGFVDFDEAAFTTLGAIALHGVRLGRPEIGDRAVVIGLGPIGLLAVQILRAGGCEVLGVDPNASRCTLAAQLGASMAVPPSDAPSAVASWTKLFGADLIVVAAAAESSDPAVLAAELARDKGRIVAIGATGLDLPRRTLYQKELSVAVSRSYGPGRYDPEYEDWGREYPLAHVRWTERENMRAFLGLVASGSVNVCPLISHRFPIRDAERAYEALERGDALGIVFDYPDAPAAGGPIHLRPVAPAGRRPDRAGVSIVGAGNFARAVLLPALGRAGAAARRGVVAATGISARNTADKFGFAYCTTAIADVCADDDTTAVIIATRHDTHAALVTQAVQAGKAVFVEKPLCLTEAELDDLVTLVQRDEASRQPLVMVGFNRRFAPLAREIRSFFDRTPGPVNVVYRVNAGRVPSTSWVGSPEGGGRIVGELCHFVDLCAYLAGAQVAQVSAVGSGADRDEVIVTLKMTNGSIATIAYLVDGDRAAPKERIELFGSGAIATIDDFRRATISTRGRTRRLGRRLLPVQDKGHDAELAAFLRAVTEGAPSPVPFDASVNSTRATLAILRSLQTGAPASIDA